MSPSKQRKVLVRNLKFILFTLIHAVTSDSLSFSNSGADTCARWNAALCKPAYMISVSGQSVPTLAVDGNRNQLFTRRSCFHTWSTRDNWWLVDLMDVYLVHRVVVTNRQGDAALKLNNVAVDLFMSDPRDDSAFPKNTNGVLCTQWGPYFQGMKSFECSTPTHARYVKMLKSSVGYFHVCEFEVIVSEKRNQNCPKTISKPFKVMKDSIPRNSVIALNTNMRGKLECVQLCRSRGHLCNGIHWTEATKSCQLMNIDPYILGAIDEKIGTDSYVEFPINCLGNGEWMYV